MSRSPPTGKRTGKTGAVHGVMIVLVICTPFVAFFLLHQEASYLHAGFSQTFIWKEWSSTLATTTGHLTSDSVEEQQASVLSNAEKSFITTTIDNSKVAEEVLTGPPPIAASVNTKHEETSANKPTIAACILVMDDSIRLLEWLAYHYTVLPLSHLLVVMDPNSKRVSSMVDVLDSWRSRINITVHVNDSEWMTLNETEGFMKPIYQKDDPTQFENWFLDKKSRQFQLGSYDRRQSHLITHCGNLMRAQENNMTWTLLTDTDEYVVFNYIHPSQENASLYPDSIRRDAHRANVDVERVNNRPYREALPPFSSRVTIADFLQQQSVSNRTACLLIPGVLVSSSESKQPSQKSLADDNSDWSRHLITLRNTWTEARHGDFTKAMLDVSQLKNRGRRRRRKAQFEPDMVHNIHWPNKQLCRGAGQATLRGTDYLASLLRFHHYASGTWEAFVERAGQDRRQVGNRRNVSAVDRFLSRSTPPKLHDGDLTPWVDWFIEKVGSEQAEALLFAPLARRYEEFKEVDPSIMKKLEQLHMAS